MPAVRLGAETGKAARFESGGRTPRPPRLCARTKPTARLELGSHLSAPRGRRRSRSPSTAGEALCFEAIEKLDAELARRATSSGRLRHALGVGLEALAKRGGHHELGFSSVEAYALERCERSARWVQQTRALVRRLEELPAIRRALMTGSLGFSMAQVLVKVASAEDEITWLETAQSRTVRQMSALVAARSGGSGVMSPTPGGERCTLTVTVDQEDAWLFECARMIASHAGGPTMDETVEALLGEGTTSLLDTMGRRTDFCLPGDEPEERAQREWEIQLAHWREEAEVLCEARFTRGPGPGASLGEDLCEGSVEDTLAFEGSASSIDVELRRVAMALAVKDREMGEVAEAFWRADGWRRLGYATGAQYARERLGKGLSSLKASRRLARRCAALPELREAIRGGLVGYEAARLVASIATPGTVHAWLRQAPERTVKHLREEVAAAAMLTRLGATNVTNVTKATSAAGAAPRHEASAAPWPPSEALMRELAALESHIVSGAVFRDDTRCQMSSFEDFPGSSAHAATDPTPVRCLVQLSAATARFLEKVEALAEAEGNRATVEPGGTRARARGRVTLRLSVTEETRRYYRWLEGLFRRRGPRGMSFVRYLCASLVETWRHTLGHERAYAEIYARDRYRCMSPVCSRRDVTPHHLQFRSAGGGEEPENLTSLCTWCHLEGVHGGRLGVALPTSAMTWSLGTRGQEHTLVHGRHRGAPR